jgi:hypothetical protein
MLLIQVLDLEGNLLWPENPWEKSGSVDYHLVSVHLGRDRGDIPGCFCIKNS